MNRKEFTRRIASVLRENDVRKPVSTPKHVFHISDDEGNTKDFVIKQTDKNVIYTYDDVDAVLEAAAEVVKDALSRGEQVSIRGFGTLGLKYRKARFTKNMYTNERLDIAARYVPRFSFGDQLRMCAKIYELSLGDKMYEAQMCDTEENEPTGADGE